VSLALELLLNILEVSTRDRVPDQQHTWQIRGVGVRHPDIEPLDVLTDDARLVGESCRQYTADDADRHEEKLRVHDGSLFASVAQAPGSWFTRRGRDLRARSAAADFPKPETWTRSSCVLEPA
jgi:hypothetical protein